MATQLERKAERMRKIALEVVDLMTQEGQVKAELKTIKEELDKRRDALVALAKADNDQLELEEVMG